MASPSIIAVPSSIDMIDANLQQLQQMQLDLLQDARSSGAQLERNFDQPRGSLTKDLAEIKKSTDAAAYSRTVARYAVATQKGVEGLSSIIQAHQNGCSSVQIVNSYLQMGLGIMAACGPVSGAFGPALGGMLNSFLGGGDGMQSALKSVVQAVVRAVKGMVDNAVTELKGYIEKQRLDEMIGKLAGNETMTQMLASSVFTPGRQPNTKEDIQADASVLSNQATNALNMIAQNLGEVMFYLGDLSRFKTSVTYRKHCPICNLDGIVRSKYIECPVLDKVLVQADRVDACLTKTMELVLALRRALCLLQVKLFSIPGYARVAFTIDTQGQFLIKKMEDMLKKVDSQVDTWYEERILFDPIEGHHTIDISPPHVRPRSVIHAVQAESRYFGKTYPMAHDTFLVIDKDWRQIRTLRETITRMKETLQTEQRSPTEAEIDQLQRREQLSASPADRVRRARARSW